jgi:hypothetical protein
MMNPTWLSYSANTFAARRDGTYVMHFANSGEEALQQLTEGIEPSLSAPARTAPCLSMILLYSSGFAGKGRSRRSLRQAASISMQRRIPQGQVLDAPMVGEDAARLAGKVWVWPSTLAINKAGFRQPADRRCPETPDRVQK